MLVLKDKHPEFSLEKLDALVEKKVRVAGEISDFHGSPQLIVDSPSQIDLVEA